MDSKGMEESTAPTSNCGAARRCGAPANTLVRVISTRPGTRSGGAAWTVRDAGKTIPTPIVKASRRFDNVLILRKILFTGGTEEPTTEMRKRLVNNSANAFRKFRSAARAAGALTIVKPRRRQAGKKLRWGHEHQNNLWCAGSRLPISTKGPPRTPRCQPVLADNQFRGYTGIFVGCNIYDANGRTRSACSPEGGSIFLRAIPEGISGGRITPGYRRTSSDAGQMAEGERF